MLFDTQKHRLSTFLTLLSNWIFASINIQVVILYTSQIWNNIEYCSHIVGICNPYYTSYTWPHSETKRQTPAHRRTQGQRYCINASMQPHPINLRHLHLFVHRPASESENITILSLFFSPPILRSFKFRHNKPSSTFVQALTVRWYSVFWPLWCTIL